MPEKHAALLGAGLVRLPHGASKLQVAHRWLLVLFCLAASAQLVQPAPGAGAEGFARPRTGGCPAPAPRPGGLLSGGASGGCEASAAVSAMPKSLPSSASRIPGRVGWDYPALSQHLRIAGKSLEHGKGWQPQGGALAQPSVPLVARTRDLGSPGTGCWRFPGTSTGHQPS